MKSAGAIGVFDSGVGGLSVWREIARELPGESTVYLADQGHLPYGPRPAAQVREFSEGIARFLLEQDCKLIVVACNTASAAALHPLRAAFPGVPFVGMEPAVKPAAQQTRRGVVGVMATPGTLQGQLFAQTAGRFAQGVRLVNTPCPGLVERIEAGELDGAATERLLRGLMAPILEAQADTIVLACTHYPFVGELIGRIAGGDVQVIDPAPAVARQVRRVLEQRGLLAGAAAPTHRFCTTAAPAGLANALNLLLRRDGGAQGLRWRDGALHPAAEPA